MMTGFQRQVLMPSARRPSAESNADHEDASWRVAVRKKRDAMVCPPVQVQPEPPVELLAATLYHSPAWVEARAAAAQVEAES